MQRNPNQQSGGRRGQGDEDRSSRFRRDDEGRYSSAEDERDYGSYTENDEGDSSVRAGSYDQGRVQYGRESREQRGPERYAGYGNFGQGDYGRHGDERGGQRYGSREQSTGQGYGRGRSGEWGQSGQADPFRQPDNYGYGYGGGGAQSGGHRQSYYEQRGRSSSGQSNYDQPRYDQPRYGQDAFGDSRRSFGDTHFDTGAQHRQSAPGGFGHAQGSSAWRGHGVEGDYGNFSSGGWSEPYNEGQPYGSRGESSGAAGQHRGKGPKGYQRSDDRLKEMICERLREDPYIDASDVTISVQNSRVTLDGTVDSRHTKNLVEDVAEQFGVDDVQNNLRVQRAGAGPGQVRGAGGQTSGGKSATAIGSDDEQTKQRRN